MNRTAVRGDETTGAGRGAFAAIFVVGTALALLLIVRARPGPEPFDPRSSAPSGATALVELLERSGATVDITRTPPAPGADVRVLVLLDELDDEQRSATLDFVEAGGVLVVADPASTLHGGSDIEGGSIEISGSQLPVDRADVDLEANVRPGVCSIQALSRLRGLYVPDGVLFPVGPTESQCFAEDGHAFVIVRTIGSGTVVGFGDNEVLVNRHLRRADNAGLATSLLAPDAGQLDDAQPDDTQPDDTQPDDTQPSDNGDGNRVVIVLGTGTASSVADVGSGEDTLIDLVPSWFWMVLVLGSLGFVAFAASRSVRLGKVLDEPLATPIAGSELVAATGNLMQRAKHSSRAGWLLQTQLHRELCRAHRVDINAPLADLDHAVSTRAGTPPGTVESLLREQVSDDTQLLALSSRIERIRREVLT